jgi:YHS domain-containing protein
MNSLARMVRFLFWLLVFSWGLRLLRRMVAALLGAKPPAWPQAAGASQEFPAAALSRRLVRDPVCGLHVDETRSMALRDGGELVHFCSPACRDAYSVNARKFAANG